MPDPHATHTLSLAVPQIVHMVGAVAFTVMGIWAWIWSRGIAARRGSDPHAVFIARLSISLFLLGLSLAIPAVLRPPRGGKRELADAARSAAVLGCGVVTVLIAGARRDATTVAGARSRIGELEGDLGGLVAAVTDQRKQVEAMRGRAEAASTIDASTGLASRKFFDDTVGRDLKRAKRSERPVALILAEIDFLEKYASSFGRQAADQLVQTVAGLFKGQIRDTDLLARYAPGRFALLMPETEMEKAAEIADWIRSMVSNSPFPHRAEMPGERISVSLGVGAFPNPLGDPATFQSLVEAALERAAAEKNRVKPAG